MVLFSNGCFHTLPDGCLLLCMCLCMYFHFFFFASAWREHIGAGLEMELREEKVKLRTEKKRREEKVGCLSISSSFTACAGFYPTINPKAIPCPPDYPATMLTMDAICISLDASQDQFLRSPVARPFLLWSPCWLGLFSRSVMMLDVKTLLSYWPVFMEIKSYNSFN